MDLLPESRIDEAKSLVMGRAGIRAPSTSTTAIGFMDENKDLVGAFLFERYTGPGGSIFLHWAHAGEKSMVTRSNLELVAHYVFEQLECQQALGEVHASNKYVRSIDERLGFVEIATIPGYFPGDDMVIYSMRREACIWLPQELEEAS